MLALIFDLETEGFAANHKVAEVGFILIDTDTLYPIVKGSFVLPSIPHEVTGIPASSTVLMNEEMISVSKQLFEKCWNMADFVLAHNISFDMRFIPKLNLNLQPKPEVCTLKKVNWQQYISAPDNKLQTISKILNIEVKAAHTALNDCEVLLECLKAVNVLPKMVAKFSGVQVVQPDAPVMPVAPIPQAQPTPVVYDSATYVFTLNSVSDAARADKRLEVGEDGVGRITLIGMTKSEIKEQMSLYSYLRPPYASLSKF